MFYIMILNIPLYQGKASKNEQDKKKKKGNPGYYIAHSFFISNHLSISHR